MPRSLAEALYTFYAASSQSALTPDDQRALFEFIEQAARSPARAEDIETGVVALLTSLPQPWPTEWAQELGRQIGFSIGLLRYLARR